ncbi:hypothetical protein NQF87_06685 [Bombella sp. TMW 2.2559]|uniref:Reverse transcriptase domain-containing protein n=1 Tax=Bombella dulcis TaxID=2967339 RepID=A0ABT3WE68_9PROT|nr:hypothetical protein [Bombella dulcis]MCX5616654.1 hypothetical protein [Bombella dulcis]
MVPGPYSPHSTIDSHRGNKRFSSKITLCPEVRKYKHFDLPLPSKKNRFFDFSTEQKKQVKKTRSIRFVSRSDALYLQAYAEYLNLYYEKYLTECALTHRKEIDNSAHHARSFFCEISQKKKCPFLALDTKNFFNKVNHIILRNAIKILTNKSTLSGHHYTV